MLIAWDQVALAALLASGFALVLLLGANLLWKVISIPHVVGLTICAGAGLTIWFIIFNLFSLKGLDFDFPIPLFPVSPEDLSCMIVTGLLAFIYGFVVKRLLGQGSDFPGKSKKGAEQINSSARLEWWVCLLPALAALIIDVYFI